MISLNLKPWGAPMKIHILGICGTFMGGLALIAKQMGYEVSGSDENVYPPMSDVLQEAGITVYRDFDIAHLKPAPDVVIIGNVMKRGHPVIEYVLNKGLRYTSGPQWLAEEVLSKRQVLPVAGTHGKTTTASILAWILHSAKLNPGYLIGGVPLNFGKSAELGQKPYFVLEADEYDCAFFDKRSKFMHSRPRVLILNNLEYDHADIFPNLEAIKVQLSYLLRLVPGCGTIIHPHQDSEVDDVISRGCWSSTASFGITQGMWQARHINTDGSRFELWHRDQKLGVVEWSLLGLHNIRNALAAVAAAHEVGVTSDVAIGGLNTFKGVKRRMEIRGQVKGITVYDDFAHHPTAIATTIQGLRSKVGSERIFAVLQFGSNTMRMGTHRNVIAESLKEADHVVLLRPQDNTWDVGQLIKEFGARAKIFNNIHEIINALAADLKASDHVLIMSNKGFEGIHQKLIDKLRA